jgi:N-acetyllactosaminide beta-1,3-N-acetylglucosaminyltransferase
LQPDYFRSARASMKYPQSLMRNTAKNGCQTDYTFVVDVDMIPNPGLDDDLDHFLSRVGSCKVKESI